MPLPPDLLETIRQLHASPDRGYHGWSHPQALLALLPSVRDRLHDPLAVECAILLHDAIYDPTRGDNERKSAELARDLLAGVVPEETLRRAAQMIEATEKHVVPESASPEEAEDLQVFLDLDLSVLGGSEEAFDAYEAGVRHEYHVPQDVFDPARAAILERFLARDRLYLSEWGHDRFEDRARANLSRSLRKLRAC